MSSAYDLNPVNQYPSYTLLFCIQRDEGFQGGNLVFYPQYEEENSITAALSQLITQCRIPYKELDVPFSPGTMILLSGETWYSMEPLRGKGTCLLMMIDFFTDG